MYDAAVVACLMPGETRFLLDDRQRGAGKTPGEFKPGCQTNDSTPNDGN
jgi:hypothetical protein